MGYKMAKPIRATPVLKGGDAVKFIKAMNEVENGMITPQQRSTAVRIKENLPNYRRLLAPIIVS